MVGIKLRTALQHFCSTLHPQGEATLSDAHLLERWTSHRDEVAFELLLRRHGPMVFALCRRLLGQTQDAEDAFQATFLVLVRRSGCIRKGTALGSWLYRVAYRVALRARHRNAIPLVSLEQNLLLENREPLQEVIWRDLRTVLDEEVDRLPPRYRDAFVLCHLQGKTSAEAARELGCPPGTVQSRLSRARARLRSCLTRRGITISTGALTLTLMRQTASASLPPLLAASTFKHALLTAGIATVAGQQVPTAVSSLCQGVLKAMFLTKLKIAVSLLLMAGLMGLTGGLVAYQSSAQETGKEGGTVLVPKQVPVAGQELKEQTTLKIGEGSSWSLAFSPDSHWLVLGSEEGALYVWPVTGEKEPEKFAGHTKAVTRIAFSPDGKYLASAGLDGIIVLRDAVTGKILCQIEQPQPVLALAFSPDGKTLASGGQKNAVHFWEVPTGLRSGKVQRPTGDILWLDYDSPGQLLVSGKDGQAITIWDPELLQSGNSWFQKSGKLFSLPPGNIGAIAFSPKGKLLATGNKAGLITLMDMSSGKQVRQIKGHTDEILALAFTADGKILASSGKDQTLRLWNVATGKLLSQAEPGAPVSGLTIAPNGKHLISADQTGRIKMWDLETGKQIVLPKVKIIGDGFPADKGKDRLSQLIKELIQRQKTDEECIEALFLAALGRYPTGTEQKFAGSHLAKNQANRQQALEDILINITGSKEFTVHLQHLQSRGPSAWKLGPMAPLP